MSATPASSYRDSPPGDEDENSSASDHQSTALDPPEEGDYYDSDSSSYGSPPRNYEMGDIRYSSPDKGSRAVSPLVFPGGYAGGWRRNSLERDGRHLHHDISAKLSAHARADREGALSRAIRAGTAGAGRCGITASPARGGGRAARQQSGARVTAGRGDLSLC